MSGYWFIIVLVTLSSQPLNTIVRASKATVPYYPYDNVCTRIKPAASVNETIGIYNLCFTQKKYAFCDKYTVFEDDDHFNTRLNMHPSVNRGFLIKFDAKRSYENPDVPGQMQDYPISYSTSMINNLNIEPKSVSVVAVYNKDVGYGMISCKAVNKSRVFQSLVLENMEESKNITKSQIEAIREELGKIVNETKSIIF
ncbi:hypothetical protein CHUAL_000171 [Chamberlinius hualienensis]